MSVANGFEMNDTKIRINNKLLRMLMKEQS